MNTGAYETALRGQHSLQPMRNDTLRGSLSGTKEFWTPAAILVGGLGLLAIKDRGISFDNKIMMTGGAFLTGWLLGGGASII
tara:strand:+ start:351 stop:596 length:246 start_codon:yes stop_codon:yes gene_type:complete